LKEIDFQTHQQKKKKKKKTKKKRMILFLACFLEAQFRGFLALFSV
jgi:hypothetical protein